MITISICNQKGGVGKTTTAGALVNALSLKGYKTLAIDVNAQRNLSQIFNASTQGITVKDVLLEPVKVKEAIQTTEQGDIIAGDKALANIDVLQKNNKGKYNRLKEALSSLEAGYDFCVIDTPPLLNTSLINCLMASDYVVIAAEADIFSIVAVEDIGENIADVQENYNKDLKIAGILLTRFTGRASLSKQLQEAMSEPAKRIGTKVFKTPVREAVAVRESHIMRQSIYDYAPKSNPASDYLAFTEELLTTIGIKKRGKKK